MNPVFPSADIKSFEIGRELTTHYNEHAQIVEETDEALTIMYDTLEGTASFFNYEEMIQNIFQISKALFGNAVPAVRELIQKKDFSGLMDLSARILDDASGAVQNEYARVYPVQKRGDTNFNLNSLVTFFLGGFDNAVKTYLGFAKLTFEKFFAKVGEVSSKNLEQFKTALKNNRHLATQMAAGPKAMLGLFDTLSGVIVNSTEPYNYDANNFDLYERNGDPYLLARPEYVDRIKDAFDNNEKVIMPDIHSGNLDANGNPVNGRGTHAWVPVKDISKTKTKGCFAANHMIEKQETELQQLLEPFFDEMDKMICQFLGFISSDKK